MKPFTSLTGEIGEKWGSNEINEEAIEVEDALIPTTVHWLDNLNNLNFCAGRQGFFNN